MLIGQQNLSNKIIDFKDAIYVEAPAGCGKTFSCINSIKVLIDNGKLKKYQKVLILTFSKNARAQLISELNKNKEFLELNKKILITNYHSFYKIYIDKYRDVLGIKKDITIVDDVEYKEIYSLKENDKIEFGELYKIGSKYFESSNNKEVFDTRRIKLYEEQYNRCLGTGIVTFDMFGIFINMLMEKSTKLADLISHDFPYLFLDEYQDTDELQELFLSRLYFKSKFVFFADPIQMIYDFKGASQKRLTNLKKNFLNLVEIKFIENYRYKDKKDIIKILDDIRIGNHPDYSFLTSGYTFEISVRADNPYGKIAKNIIPSATFYSILNQKRIRDRIRSKSICILVRKNELVDKLCELFEEYGIICNEISDSKYMLRLNIYMKKIFANQCSNDNFIRYALQIYCLCKRNHKIEDEKMDKLKDITEKSFFRKRKPEFVLVKNIFQKYANYFENKREIIKELITLIDITKKNYAAFRFVESVINSNLISEKIIDNIYIQRQYYSSYSTISPGLYISNYHQSKGREFDDVIVIIDDSMNNYQKNRNLLYVTHSRMKEKLYVATYKYVGNIV
jgi:putative helicase